MFYVHTLQIYTPYCTYFTITLVYVIIYYLTPYLSVVHSYHGDTSLMLYIEIKQIFLDMG